MKKQALTLCLLLAAITTATAGDLRRWDFTQWSAETVANLKADTEGWSDIEKADATEPTELSAGNCFWEVTAQGSISGKTLKANGEAIAELEGLLYTNTTNRSLAIAVNYGDCSSINGSGFGPYHGTSYLWLGSRNKDYIAIPDVPAGAVIRMGVESHKLTDARGVELFIGFGNEGTKLVAPDGSDVSLPTEYAELEWVVPTDAADQPGVNGKYNVQIRNTNGCHIYYIEVEDGSTWNFKKGFSDETIKNLDADETWTVNWNEDSTWKNVTESGKHSGKLSANGVEIAELAGLTLSENGLLKSNNVVINTKSFRLTRNGMQLILPKLVAKQTITVRACSANSTATNRGLKMDENVVTIIKQPTNGICPGKDVESEFREEDGNFTFVWQVNESVTEPTDIAIETITGGLDIASISIDRRVVYVPVYTTFQAEVNGRMMNFRVTDKAEKTVETYPCSEFSSKKAIEFFEGETEHIGLSEYKNLVIPATVVCPDDGETYRVVGIGENSFLNIWWFNSTVTIEEGVTYIGKSGFFNNRYEKIVLPSTISSIADDAFGKSWNLEVMKVGMKSPVSKAVVSYDNKGNKELAKLLVPEGTREAYAAAEYWNLFGTIEEYRPAGTIFIAQTEQGIDMQFRVLDDTEMTVETYAVPYAEGETFVPAIDINTSGELIIPATIEGYRVVGIGGWSFRECRNITSASLPVGITYIDGSAFRLTLSLQSINIPEGVESIGEYAFNGSPMTTISLPSTLKRISGEKVFKNDKAKRVEGEFTVIANMTEPCPMDEGSIYYKEYYNLYVPKGSKAAYLADPLWSQFLKIREIGEVDEDVKDMIAADDVTVKAGETATLTVSLTTKDTDYNAYQFYLYLPEGISIATSQNGKFQVSEKTDRTSFATPSGDCSFLLAAYTFDKEDFLVAGPLMEINLNADPALPAGEYTARMERVICANSADQAIALPTTTFTIIVENTTPEEPAIVEADDVEGQPNGQITLPVFLNNPTDINAFYFDLTLPKGITVAEDEAGQILASLVGEYAEGKLLLTSMSWNSNIGTTNNVNTWRFFATPLSEDYTIKANAGHVMNITLNVDPNIASGVYTARLNIVQLFEVTNEGDGSRGYRVMRAQATNATTSFAKITIIGAPGDVNGDTAIDVADIAAVISRMAGDNTIPVVAADVNHDGVVDVADIATVIDIMAGIKK